MRSRALPNRRGTTVQPGNTRPQRAPFGTKEVASPPIAFCTTTMSQNDVKKYVRIQRVLDEMLTLFV